MPDTTTGNERRIDAGAFALVTGAQSEQALRSAIQRLERLGDASLDLAQALVKLGALRQEKGGHSEAEELFTKALDVSERTLGSEHIELVQPLTSLGTARILRGSPESAEQLFNRALTISTRYLGEDHPDLVIMVNDIARLYLKHGAYPLAEPLLQRLLSMKRSKGEDHPEVATVLASLAAVRQARGQHESAEELWRRVLAIRERTLAPNHFAQAIALEHLADVCTARGKIGEALQLFQRAQMIREMTLGSDHASLRISRERIADLQLQASEDSIEVHYPRAARPQSDDERPADQQGVNSSVGRRPRETKRRARTESVTPFVERESPRPTERVVPFVDRELPTPPTTNAEDTPPTTREAPPDDSEEREAAAQAFRASLLEERHTPYETDEEEPLGLVAELFASGILLVRKNQGEVLAVAGVLVVLLIALAATTRASSEIYQPIAESRSAATVSLPTAAPRPLPATTGQLKVPGPAGDAATTRVITPIRPSAQEQRTTERLSERRVARESISIPTLAATMTNRFDSLIQAAGAPPRILNEAIPAPPPPDLTSANAERPTFSRADSRTPQPSHAMLIGPLPVPRYPDQVSGVEGEVVVRFTVDTVGRPEMSTFSAVTSPHVQLTAAVRKVIQGLRFEPARAAGPGSKAILDPVEIRYVFARPER